ncbi:hypothetical protein BESB_030360 [Besnoitia besnoiti]|uniref:Transmembrane protein n=1 Tax=Besnoitia besnoiti TaxID=94643 RepID=A0A2A9M702_BESBE|nr:hypothetical protein BESB_030360 [Besnoitia besnoiti]PFH31162.1 hypothetical protein BESB_030360 [Besnoitia besnoiti]
MGTFGVYTLLVLLGLGGTIFFVIRHVQGHPTGFMPYYLAVLLIVSLCSITCHAILLRRRLDHDLSAAQEASTIPLQTPQATPPKNRISRIQGCAKLLHAYAVFLFALLIAVLTLFDLITGYTISHFRPAHLARTMSLAIFQCILVVLALAWFLVALSVSSDDGKSSGIAPGRETIRPTSSSSRECRLPRWWLTQDSPGFQDIALKEVAVETPRGGSPPSGNVKQNGPFGRWGTGSASSEVSTTCPAGRGVSAQWEDLTESSDANQTVSGGVQPCVIGLPTFSVVRATPIRPPPRDD